MAKKAPQRDAVDPRDLIREAYAIDGIGEPECRSIFLDWAIGVPVGDDTRAHVETLLARYETAAPDHPMTHVLRDGLGTAARSGRRGGRRGRLGDA